MLYYCKLQICCLVLLSYIGFIFLRECKTYHVRLSTTQFDQLWYLAMFSIVTDGATAYVVNHLDTVPGIVVDVLHALFLVGLDAVVFMLFLYILSGTGLSIKNSRGIRILTVPFVLNVAFVLCTMPKIFYVRGTFTNYSMGLPVYACYVLAALYILLTIGIVFRRWRYIEAHKRTSIMTYLLAIVVVSAIQMVYPEVLLTSLAVTIMILGVYMNLEAPAFKALSAYHSETIMAFATLIERRDNSTGGHIRRTGRYVAIICGELQKRGLYGDVLTRDYVDDLLEAAPMHDIGKIAVPDAILQKPGKLTNEEFDTMKQHAAEGGKIILETFRNFGDEEYRHMAYQVARYHHEKWNGRGYPEGLKGADIPLCARVMAVADVFDAVSQKRCYRDAMPLEDCFAIIEKGGGTDFEPQIVDAFLAARPQVEAAFREMVPE